MANETSALRSQPSTGRVAEQDYQSFCDAVGASERGRAFLQEYARRNRHADTEVVLAALARIESVARSQKTSPEAERIRQDLRALLGTIHSARPQIDSTPGAIKSATLAALIEFVQARIEALVSPTNAPLAAVPEPEQRELPIPRPGPAAPRPISLVETIAPAEPVPAAELRALSFNPAVPTAPRNFDPDAPPFDAPRSRKIIPAVDFIETLFEQASPKVGAAPAAAKDSKKKSADKAAAKAGAKSAAKTTTEADSPAPPLPVNATPIAFVPSAILASVDMPGPMAIASSNTDAGPPDLSADQAAVISQTLALAESADQAVGLAEAGARTGSATAAAIDASAAAIDEIVAAAEAVIVEEAARAQQPSRATPLVETSFVEITAAEPPRVSISVPDATGAEAVVPTVVAGSVTNAATKAAGTPAASSSTQMVDNALSAIMALSEEERLALFT
jgi:hypothetical protein